MDNHKMLERTRKFVKANAINEPGHDWSHIERVVRNAKFIARREGADLFIVEMAALLHDLDDHKFSHGTQKARRWLDAIGLEEEKIDEIMHIVSNISFKGSGEKNKIKSLEGKVVQDADRLDALGAIGVARVFSFAGYKNNKFHDPHIKPRKFMSYRQYIRNESTAINHFYEKVLLLKNMMNTKSGKSIAQKRHRFVEAYLKQFFKEWEGKE